MSQEGSASEQLAYYGICIAVNTVLPDTSPGIVQLVEVTSWSHGIGWCGTLLLEEFETGRCSILAGRHGDRSSVGAG